MCGSVNYRSPTPTFVRLRESNRRKQHKHLTKLGVDVKTIAEWQGHRDGGKLILDTYSHVRAPHAGAMAKLLV